MSLSLDDYARISKDSYQTRTINQRIHLGAHDYDVIAVSRSSALGFQATAYRRRDQDEVVIAYRGTEFQREPLRDGGVDAAMVLTGINPQEVGARSFTEEVVSLVGRLDWDKGTPTHISVTGHSLGGTLAELNGARFGFDGQTFNAYGAADLAPDLKDKHTRVVNHVRAGDPVSAASAHLGEVRIYAAQRDIYRIDAAGYGHHDRFNNLRTALATDFSAHGIENFVSGNAILGKSILDHDAETRYRDNKDLVDSYRTDVYNARSHASVAWETQRALTESVGAVGKHIGDAATHGAHALAYRTGQGAVELQRVARESAHALEDGAARAGMATAGAFRATGLVPEEAAKAVWGSQTGSAELDRLLHPPMLTDVAHPDHRLFKQALEEVHALDARTGRGPDQLSGNLAGALTVEARRHGFTQIDHVLLSDDAMRAYVVQGEMNSPFKKIAEISTESGISASIEKSSAQWRDVVAHEVSSPTVVTQATSQPHQGGISPDQTAPSIAR